jgi:hypothetical protein
MHLGRTPPKRGISVREATITNKEGEQHETTDKHTWNSVALPLTVLSQSGAAGRPAVLPFQFSGGSAGRD